jgi:hypothetical protein
VRPSSPSSSTTSLSSDLDIFPLLHDFGVDSFPINGDGAQTEIQVPLSPDNRNHKNINAHWEPLLSSLGGEKDTVDSREGQSISDVPLNIGGTMVIDDASPRRSSESAENIRLQGAVSTIHVTGLGYCSHFIDTFFHRGGSVAGRILSSA